MAAAAIDGNSVERNKTSEGRKRGLANSNLNKGKNGAPAHRQGTKGVRSNHHLSSGVVGIGYN